MLSFTAEDADGNTVGVATFNDSPEAPLWAGIDAAKYVVLSRRLEPPLPTKTLSAQMATAAAAFR